MVLKNIISRLDKLDRKIDQSICCNQGNGNGGGTGSGALTRVDFSVNANPNTGGTTFSPDNPHDVNSLYVSTIDGSLWVWNGTTYITYVSPFWGITGNSGITGSNFIGTINNAALKFRTNNVERINISSTGFVGIGITPGSVDKLEVMGNIKATNSALKASTLTLGLLPNNGFIIDAYNSGFISERLSTSTDPTTGFGSVRTMYTYDPNTGNTNVKGWRAGLNTGGISGGYTPSYDYTIDELSTGTFHNVFKIKFTSNFVGINMGNTNEPTSQLDVNGDARIRNLGGGGTKMVVTDNTGSLSTQSIPVGALSSVDNETPGGIQNSINDTFTLANTPDAGSLKVYLRGLRKKQGTHYTVSGTTLTMIDIPDALDDFIVDYRY